MSHAGKKVYTIDGISTIIYSAKGNVAKAAIINKDLTLKDCYVAKSGNYFAHGDTIEKAVNDAQRKLLLNIPVEERIQSFKKKFKVNKKYSAKDYYEWHTILTGSCDSGKDSFVRNNGISMEDSFTPKEFCNLVKNAYGSDVIKKLINALNS